MEEHGMHRINIRISNDLNQWLDEESKETGMSKSAIMMLATENYRRDKESYTAMQTIEPLMGQIQQMSKDFEERIAKLEKELKKP